VLSFKETRRLDANMTSRTKNNYKAKWLAAARDAGNDVLEHAEKAPQVSETIISADVTAHVELNKVQVTAYEMAAVAKTLTNLMNETKVTAGVNYGEIDHAIDSKLSKMPLNVILRRVRDVMKHAEFRIGMLSIACDELTEAGSTLARELRSVQVQSQFLQKTTVDALIVGPQATSSELDDYGDLTRMNKRYHRYGLQYSDLNEDIFENFGMHANHRQQVANPPLDDESGDDSDSDNDQQVAIVERNSRSVMNGQASKRNDSGVSGLDAILGK